MYLWTKKRWLNFGSHLVLDPDLGHCWSILQLQDRAFFPQFGSWKFFDSRIFRQENPRYILEVIRVWNADPDSGYGLQIRIRFHLAEVYAVTSLGLVSPGTVTDGVTPIFSLKNLRTCLFISLGCHPLPWRMSPRTFLPVPPRLSTVLCKFSHNFFSFGCHPPGECHPGRSPLPIRPPSAATWRRSVLSECSHSVAVFFTMQMPTMCKQRQCLSSNLVTMEPCRRETTGWGCVWLR